MTNSEQYVLFEVSGTTYAVSSGSVRHIEMLEHVTVVPNANPAVDGVVFSRGQVIPALNLRTRFGFSREAPTPRTRIVFVQVQDRTIGLIADSAREFVRIPPETLRPIGQTLAGVSGNYLKAVAQLGPRLIMLLDLDAVADVDQIIQPAEQAAAPDAPPPENANYLKS